MNEERLVFSYYEIVNIVSETQSKVSGRYATLEAAQEALKGCCDWYRPIGTGKIYKLYYFLDYGAKINVEKQLVFEVF